MAYEIEINPLNCDYSEFEEMCNEKLSEITTRTQDLNLLMEAGKVDLGMLKLIDLLFANYKELLEMLATGIKLSPNDELKNQWINTSVRWAQAIADLIELREQIADFLSENESKF